MYLKELSVLFLILTVIACGSNRDSKQVNQTSAEDEQITVPANYDSLQNVTAYDTTSSPQYGIALQEVAKYDEPQNTFFNALNHFAVDNNGKVYTINESRIEVFAPTGKHLKTLGGEGKGPGEFNNMVQLKPKVYDGKLYAYDDILSRINSYNTDSLSFSESIIVNPKEWSHIYNLKNASLSNFYVISDSLFLLEFEEYTNNKKTNKLYKRYYLMNHKGQVNPDEVFRYRMNLDNTLMFLGKNGEKRIPFRNAAGRYVRIQFDDNNNIYVTRTGDFFIRVYNSSGTYKRAIYYPYKNKPLDKDDLIETYDYNKRALKQAKNHDYPATWSAIDHFFVDDEGRIWVATIINDEDHYKWWVLGNSGKLLGKFKWPGKRLERHSRFRVYPKIKNGYFYDHETDSSTGQGQIVKYNINFEEH